jgi:hypothetical protein
VRLFDNEKGYKIIDIVYRHQGLGFRELQRKTGFRSRKTLDIWINRLRNLGILPPYPKMPIRLTEAAIQRYENGSLVLPIDSRSNKAIRTKRKTSTDNEKTDQDLERRRDAYLLILSIATFGATYYRRTSKFKAGQVSSADIYKNEKISYSSYERPGVGLVDLVDKQKTRLSYLPPRLKNIGNDQLFGYISLIKSEAEQYIKELQGHNPPILNVINYKPNGKTRYGITDPLLREFISLCITTLGGVEMKMQYVWLYKRPIRKFMKDDENKWYTQLYGRRGRRLTSYLLNLVKMKKDFTTMNKGRQNELTLNACKVIDQYDKSLKQRYQLIMGQKYRSVREKYSRVTEPLIKAVYPDFLKAEYFLV